MKKPNPGVKRRTMGFFSTPIWRVEWSDNLQLPDLESTVLRMMKDAPNGVVVSNCGGWQSPPGVFDQPEFKALHARIQKEVTRINPRLKMTRGWANVNPPGTRNIVHIHPACALSGVFYIAANEKSGDIVFNDPRDVAIAVGGLPNFVSRPVPLKPKPGMLLLFPSWLPHEVVENQSDTQRISLAFNARLYAPDLD